MLNFQSIPNNKPVKDSLRAALNSRFPQAVLLTGPAGCGKMQLAYVLAAALLCTSTHERPCGICPSCQKMEHHVHPDLDIIDEGSADLPVALAREIRQKVCVLPNDGEHRVVILRHAHKLNTAAQNALLKVLEEPPRYAFFILTSEQPGMILETIRSRCTRYHLAPKQEETPQDCSVLLEKIIPFLHALADANEYQMLRAAMALEKQNKAEFQNSMRLLQEALRDAIFCANGLSDRLLPDLKADILRLANRIGNARLIQLYDFAGKLSQRTEINASSVIQCADLCAGAYSICYL